MVSWLKTQKIPSLPLCRHNPVIIDAHELPPTPRFIGWGQGKRFTWAEPWERKNIPTESWVEASSKFISKMGLLWLSHHLCLSTKRTIEIINNIHIALILCQALF